MLENYISSHREGDEGGGDSRFIDEYINRCMEDNESVNRDDNGAEEDDDNNFFIDYWYWYQHNNIDDGDHVSEPPMNYHYNGKNGLKWKAAAYFDTIVQYVFK